MRFCVVDAQMRWLNGRVEVNVNVGVKGPWGCYVGGGGGDNLEGPGGLELVEKSWSRVGRKSA